MINHTRNISEYNGDDFAEYLERLQLIHIFQEVIKEYGKDKPLLKMVIKYIVLTYSLDSELVPIGGEWGMTKKSIFEYVMLPNGVCDDLIELKSKAVVDSVNNWLDSQNNDVYTQLVKLKDLKTEFQMSFSRPIEEVSYNQKFDNAVNCEKLTDMIKRLESQLIQNSIKLGVGYNEVKQQKKKNTMGAEKFAK